MPGNDPTGKVLVLGSDFKNYRSCLTIIRSFGRHGLEVHVGWCSDDVALSSKYVARVHDIPSYSPTDDSWKEKLISIVQAENLDLVVPVNEQASTPLETHRSDFGKLDAIYLLNEQAYDVVFDKFKTNELASALGIRIPKGKRVSGEDQTENILSEFNFPIVLKPKVSFSLDNLRIKNYVYKAYNKKEFSSCLKLLLNSGDVLVQENFVGIGVGIEFLASQGNLLHAFQHQRVHEPLMGGGSSYRKSVPLHPELLTATDKLLKALDYTGVGMAEFKVNFKTKDWVFLEINGRFWGSLPLAVSAGSDFPYFLYQLMVKKKQQFPQTYKTGLYCRNTIRDFEWIIKNIGADKSDPSRNTLPNRQVAREIFNILAFREKNDTWVIDDIKPGFIELKHFLSLMFDKIRLAILSYSPIRWLRTYKARLALRKARTILFVCFGNIYRSPFAKYYAQTVLSGSLKINSSGYHNRSGRVCHQKAIDVAHEFGIDLKHHRSSVITDDMVKKADIVLTFDKQNRNILIAKFPFARKKIYYLGIISYRGAVIIDDPVDSNIYTVREIFKTIKRAIDSFKNEK